MVNPSEVEDLKRLLYTHRQALRLLQHKRRYPDSSTTIATDLEIDERIQSIIGLKAQLRRLDVPIDDQLGDVLAERPASPYRGLEPFTLAEAGRFFGRDSEVQALLRQLSLARFCPIIGASGSGKSSLVQAGLIPALAHSELFGVPGPWICRTFRPGADPLSELAHALGADPADLAAAVGQLRASEPGARRCLLVVDQFEELFTVATAPHSQLQAFQQALVGLAALPECYVIVTVRADFYPDLMSSPIWAAIQHSRYELGALSDAGLRQAITSPAAEAEVLIEAALVERIVADSSGDAGALPLIQATLQLLWDQMRDWRLTLRAYEAFGGAGRNGLQVALALRADAALAQLGSDQARAIAKRIFVRLIQEIPGRQPARRRLPVLALCGAADDAELFEATLQHLADPQSRLITLGGADARSAAAGDKQRTADIVHDALISGWPQLQRWLEELRAHELTRRRLEAKAEEWRRLECQAGLLDPIELREAEQWLLSAGAAEVGYSAELARFIDASRAAVDAAQAQRERTTRRLRRLSAFLAGVSLVALAVAGLAGWLFFQAQQSAGEARASADAARLAQRSAERQGRVARAQALAGNAVAELENDPERSILLAVGAISATKSLGEPVVPQAESALHRALLASQLRMTLRGHTGLVIDANYSRDGQRIVTGSDDGTARIWDAHTGQSQMTLAGHYYSLYDVAYSADGRVVGAAGDWGTFKLWDAQTGSELPPWQHKPIPADITSFALSPDGRRVALTRLTRFTNVQVWDLQTQQPVLELQGHTDYVHNVEFSPDGKTILTASGDSTAKIWDAASGQLRQTLAGHTERVISAAYSPDGRTIVTASWDHTVRLWDAQTGQPIASLAGHTDNVRTAQFSPDGASILSAGWDKTAIVWDVRTRAARLVLKGHAAKIVKAIFSPDGQAVLTADEGGQLKLWDARTGGELATIAAATDVIRGIAFRPDGRQFVSVGDAGVLQVWDAQTHQLIATHAGQPARIVAAEFSPDGRRVVTASADKTAKIWDAASGQVIRTLRGHTATVLSATFSPDGGQVLTGSDAADGSVKIWDAATGDVIRDIAPGTVGTLKPKYAPDGHTIVSTMIVTPSRDEPSLRIATIWDAATGVVLHKLQGDSRPISAGFSPDGQLVAVPYEDGTTTIWDVRTGQQHATLRRHSIAAMSAVFSPDGRSVVTAAAEGVVKIWDPHTGELRRTIVGVAMATYKASFSPDGRSILTANPDNTAKVWNSADGDEGLLLRFAGLPDEVVADQGEGYIGEDGVAYSPDGQTIAAANFVSNTVTLWNAQTGRQLAQLHGDADTAEFGLMSVAFSPDGRAIMASDSDDVLDVWDIDTMQLRLKLKGYRARYCRNGQIVSITTKDNKGVRLWDGRSGQELAVFDGRRLANRGVISADCSPDGRSLAIATGTLVSQDIKVMIWDIATATVRVTISGHNNVIGSVRYSPDGATLLTASADGSAKVWDATSGALRFTLTGHTSFVRFAEYSPDSRLIVTGGVEGMIRLWDAQTGQLRFALAHLPSVVSSAAFSPDSRSVSVGYRDGQLWRYVVDIDDLLALARSRVTRQLSPEERAQFFGAP